MDNCQKESQRHGFCSKHLSQLREPNAVSQHLQRLMSSMGTISNGNGFPYLQDFYPGRFDYGNLPTTMHAPFYHSNLPVAPPSGGLNNLNVLRSFSTPSPSSLSATTQLLVNPHQQQSAFLPLIPMIRQHSADMTSPPSSSSSTPILSNNTDSSIRRSTEDEDSEIDIETVPSPSKFFKIIKY